LDAEVEVRREVRDFYDSVGWKEIAEGLFQNARYEDLRPVAREYVHRCHMRVMRHLLREGGMLLDAGSGPIQYPEYLEYSRGFHYRVCLDISALALRQARERIGDRGLFVLGDIAHLPFKRSAFDSLVSLHTIHHLPADDQEGGFRELARVLADGGRGVIVYSWGDHSPLMRLARVPIAATRALRGMGRARRTSNTGPALESSSGFADKDALLRRPGTHAIHHDYRWAASHLANLPGFEIRVWRSVSTAFTRAFIFDPLLGRLWLRLLFLLEEAAPHWYGRIGQYPMFVIHKSSNPAGVGEEGRA
jgi:SAM-dependent methyltransferase